VLIDPSSLSMAPMSGSVSVSGSVSDSNYPTRFRFRCRRRL